MESLHNVKIQIETLLSLLRKIEESSQFSAIDKDVLLCKMRDIYSSTLSLENILAKQIETETKVVEPIIIKEISVVEPKLIIPQEITKTIEDPVHFHEKVEEIIVEEISEKEFEEEMIKDHPIELDEPLPTQKPKKHYDDDLLIRIDDVQPEKAPEIQHVIISKPQIQKEEPNVVEIEIAKPNIEAKPIDVKQEVKKTITGTPKAVIETPVTNIISNSGNSLAAKLSQTKITNIAAAMSFSDKLMFQKQLFKDRNEEFNKTLNTLNDLESFEEAYQWLQASYSWDFESQYVKKLLEIVQRRFL